MAVAIWRYGIGMLAGFMLSLGLAAGSIGAGYANDVRAARPRRAAEPPVTRQTARDRGGARHSGRRAGGARTRVPDLRLDGLPILRRDRPRRKLHPNLRAAQRPSVMCRQLHNRETTVQLSI